LNVGRKQLVAGRWYGALNVSRVTRGRLPAFYRNGPEFSARIVVFDSVMADRDQKALPNYDQKQTDGSEKVKIICLGDSAVGKSK